MMKWVKEKGKPAVLVADEVSDIIVKADKPKRKAKKKTEDKE
jgi:hypothetical protein